MMQEKYDYLEVEPKMQQLWSENETYRFEENKRKKIFSVDTPPPTVSGSLHIGHVFSYTQAEIIARYHRMQGENVYYPFGFDDNGLPTERLLEKEKGIRAKDMKRSEFAKECYEISDRYEEEFQTMWKSLGFSVDWNLKYKTIDAKSMRISQRSFLELAKQGHAYMKESPVLWCTACQTSIAQAELDTKELKSTFNYLKFSTDRGELQVATTRPELLSGCVCLFVHPEDTRYQAYIGGTALVPFYHFDIPILANDGVSMEKGTGVVMCATYGDSADVEWCEKYQLPYKKVIASDGTIAPEIPELGGLRIKQARARILELLQESQELLRQEELSHMVAVHERCGTEIEILPSKQWYIDVLTNKEQYLKAADEIEWYPKSMKNQYCLWVENLKWDWCISRQRYFGVPFPVWYCKDCMKPIFAEESQLPVNPLETQPLKACSCGCKEFIPERAVFDTWATSSVTPLIHANYEEEDEREEFLPMTLRTQAHEIIRTWTFYTIVKSLYHTGRIPWKQVMICGYVLAKKGEKISKSKNNGGLSPMRLIETHSADALRYWSANANLGTDTFFSEQDLKISKRFLTKLWNAAKFSIHQLEGFTKEELLDYRQRFLNVRNGQSTWEEEGILPYDLSLLLRAQDKMEFARNQLEQYEIGQARKAIDEFFWSDYCDYYIEVVKERLYQPEKHGLAERKSAQYAIYETLLLLLKLYGIYIPHMTEYIYQAYYRKFEQSISLHQLQWRAMPWEKAREKGFTDLIEFGRQINASVASARKYKSEHHLSMKDPMERLLVPVCPEAKDLFESARLDLMACTKAEKIELIE